MKILRTILRFVLGAFFIFSGVSKFSGMDSFEIYLYSSSFLSYDASAVLARLIIAAELLIGFSFISLIAFKSMWRFAMGFIGVLTLFLLWQFARGNDENCHCLGELMAMSPGLSVLKNIGLLVLMAFTARSHSWHFKASRWVFAAVILTSLALVTIISPPDLLIKGSYDAATHDQQALEQALNDQDIPLEFASGRKLIAFFSPGCRYCKLTSRRIGEIVSRGELDSSQVGLVFWADTTLNPLPFFEETKSPHFAYTTMDTELYLKITKGRMPLVLLVEDGEVKDQMNYRRFEESRIADFFSGNTSE